MVKSKLMLPTTIEGLPDWEFMEQYMRNIESVKILNYLSFIADRSDVLSQ